MSRANLGSDAEAVIDFEKPTMELDLSGMTDDQMQATILRTFGRVLGMGYELQYPDYRNYMRKFLDDSDLRQFLGIKRVSDITTDHQVLGPFNQYCEGYLDEDSIMHLP